jgi:branched-chain amino acid transport system substrate-binding protein
MFKAHTMSGKTWFSIFACLAMMLTGLSACGQDQNSGANFGNSTPITIGISLSLTKDFSSDGLLMEQGYKLWADMVNNSGGLLGRPVKLMILDDQSNEQKVAANYETLINTDRVDLILGPFSTLLTKAAEKARGIQNYAFIEGAGGAPSVFLNNWKNIFAVSIPVEFNLDTFVFNVLSIPSSMRPKTAAYLSSDDPFTYPQIARARKLMEQGFIKTVYPTNSNQWQYSANDSNFSAEASADAATIADLHPDVVVLGTLLGDIKAEIKVFEQKHFHPKAIIATAGPDLGQDFINAIGGEKYTEGIFVPNGWYPQVNNFQNAAMVQAYTTQYHVPENLVNADVAEAFSAGQVLQQAVEQTHSLKNATLMDYLHLDKSLFNTVQGTVKFASNGHNELALAYLFQWQRGQLIPVYPYSVAAENPEYNKYTF